LPGCSLGAQQERLFDGPARAGHILLKDHHFLADEFWSTLPSLLLGIVDHLRRRFARFNLCAHLL